MRQPAERVRDILEAIDRIERYVDRGREEFERDELIQNWFIRHIQIIGEAARALPDEVRSLAADIPWRKIIGMRHILVHDYFGIDLDFVWKTVACDLPSFKSRIEDLLAKLTQK
ncbi:MAG: HepT-like ribonuclease domain-containing protein [Candidatus Sumerlaeaceae bacterium]